MECWYCGSKDTTKEVAHQSACECCYRDFNHGNERDDIEE